jgi:hypothetical protein
VLFKQNDSNIGRAELPVPVPVAPASLIVALNGPSHPIGKQGAYPKEVPGGHGPNMDSWPTPPIDAYGIIFVAMTIVPKVSIDNDTVSPFMHQYSLPSELVNLPTKGNAPHQSQTVSAVAPI